MKTWVRVVLLVLNTAVMMWNHSRGAHKLALFAAFVVGVLLDGFLGGPRPEGGPK